MEKKLFNKDFVLLWLGQTVSQLGTGVGYIATLWWVQRETGSALALGTLAMVQTLVAFLLSPFAGVVVDRLSRKWIIVVTDIIRGVINCYFAYAVWTNTLTLPLLYVGSAITSACAQFFNPAITAAIPQLVSKNFLDKANSIRNVTNNLANIFGYSLGGIMLALVGIPALLFINGISYLLSAFSELFIYIPAVQEKIKLNLKVFVDDLKSGLQYVKNDTLLVGLMKTMLIINFAFVPFFVLLPKFVGDYLGASSDVFGYISSAQTVGLILGGMLIALTSFVKKNIWLIKWGITIQAIALMIAPLVPVQYWGIQLLIYGLFGLMNSVINISFFSALQRRIDPAFMGKVLSFIFAMILGLQPVANGLSGILADYISIAAIFIGAGVLAIFSNLLLVRVPNLESFLLQPQSDEILESKSLEI